MNFKDMMPWISLDENEAKSQVGLEERGHDIEKVTFFYIWTILKRPDGFWKL